VGRAIDLRQLVSTEVRDAAKRYAIEFASAQPFLHVVLDNFLDADFCRQLLDQFPGFDERAAINENEEIGGKATQESVRDLGPAYVQMDDLAQSAPFRNLVERITGIDDLRYDPYFFGGGTRANRQGQGLDPHIDFKFHPISRQHRRQEHATISIEG
jgi:hypothetical protein